MYFTAFVTIFSRLSTCYYFSVIKHSMLFCSTCSFTGKHSLTSIHLTLLLTTLKSLRGNAMQSFPSKYSGVSSVWLGASLIVIVIALMDLIS